MIKAIVGSGGKTSLIHKMAKEYIAQGRKVFVTTSTHMMIEDAALLSDNPKEIIQVLGTRGYVMAGIQDGRKMKALSYETYQKVCERADIVLIEADGSKHMPLKFPADFEPVIYDNVNEIVVVAGLHGLGKKAGEVVHRLELAKGQLGIEEDTIITPNHIQNMIRKGYLEKLHHFYPDKAVKIKISHDNTLYQRVIAKMIEENQDISVIEKSWFEPQPALVVCGAGHVATELVKIATCLDFYIKVVDDREEFANKERLPWADEVICDSFDNLERHLEDSGYYVVVTRGHKADLECVKIILSGSYHYLGMIGSKKKVRTTFESLREAGYREAQIQTIHAPIGLSIGANTPAEIAVSILAEIIQEKNKTYNSFVSRELLEVKEKGTLCIIIEKKGSSPRGIGSMMFVTENRTYDSIGGGSIEFHVIEDARNAESIFMKEYQLHNGESEKLGMICGGSNKVLFIPL